VLADAKGGRRHRSRATCPPVLRFLDRRLLNPVAFQRRAHRRPRRAEFPDPAGRYLADLRCLARLHQRLGALRRRVAFRPRARPRRPRAWFPRRVNLFQQFCRPVRLRH
jgi:hypothetical protein